MSWLERLQRGQIPLKPPAHFLGKWVELWLDKKLRIPLVLLWLSDQLAQAEGRTSVEYQLGGTLVVMAQPTAERLMALSCSEQATNDATINGTHKQILVTLRCVRPSSGTNK